MVAAGSLEHALHGRFLRGLAVAPSGPAIRDGGRVCGYEQAHELALGWAGALLDAAGEPPMAVAVLAEKSVETYVAILAGLYAGATVVPLNPDFPVERTRGMLASARVAAVFADRLGRQVAGQIGTNCPVITVDRPAGPALDAPRPVRPSDVAYVLFTSGSTGRPKGVPITHANTHHYFQLMDKRYDFTADDVFSQTFDVNFDCAMFDLFCAWGAGASVHPVPARAYLDLPAFVAERGMTVWFSTPSSIVLVRKMGGLRPGGLPSLRWSLFAGEAFRAADAIDWQAAAAKSQVDNIYGPTELTITVTGHRWSPAGSPPLCVHGLVPIGAVHDGHDWLLRTEHGEFVTTEGELCVTGPQMAAGYLDPEDNTGRFLRHDGRRWYRTGDRVRALPGGELVFLGRLDSQVQVHGRRVELAEIEHTMRCCGAVQDAVVVSRPADGTDELVAFYTGEPIAAAELARQLRRVLPDGMLPREYRHLDNFPLNVNRKIDRARLAREALTG